MLEPINIWFYTLSTSAQVLAALVGIFAVFVVYKLQGLSPTLEDVKMITIKILSHFSNNTDDVNFQRYKPTELDLKSDAEILEIFSHFLELRKKTQKFTITGCSLPSNLFPQLYFDLNDDTRIYYFKKVNLKEDIQRRLKISLVLGFILISLCILELSFTNYVFDLKILFFTSLIIVLYMMSITSNVYLISTK